jgi:hypothetical protein
MGEIPVHTRAAQEIVRFALESDGRQLLPSITVWSAVQQHCLGPVQLRSR